MDRPEIKKGRYQHYKNKKMYEVLGLALHTENEEWLVLYKPLYENDAAELFVRPYKMFVEGVKDPETGDTVPRFKYLK